MLLPQRQYLLQSAVVVAVLGIPAPAVTVAVRVLDHSYQRVAAMAPIGKHNTQAELVVPDLVEL
jgi:hypothetical protein